MRRFPALSLVIVQQHQIPFLDSVERHTLQWRVAGALLWSLQQIVAHIEFTILYARPNNPLRFPFPPAKRR